MLSGRYWAGLAATAERGLLDFLTIDDTLMPQPGRREAISPRRLAGRGRRRPGRRAHRPGHPAHRADPGRHRHPHRAVPRLQGHRDTGLRLARAGGLAAAGELNRHTRPRCSAGATAPSDGDELFDEAADAVEVVRRLWDSWEDDAIIRDAATGRYIDRNKLHYIDFRGKYFSVKGPSITPRPPQGQPVVAALAHATAHLRIRRRQRRSRLHHADR